MQKAQGPGVCKLPKPPANRALCQAKRAPRAAFPSACLAAQTKRWAEGIRVPAPLAGCPQSRDDSGVSWVFPSCGASAGSVSAANRTGTATTPLSIFAHAANVDYRINAKFYSLSCSRNGTVVRDFRPYLRHGVVGVRDAVTGTFLKRTAGNMFFGAPPSSASVVSEA